MNSENVFMFYRSGNCRYGRTGKKPDQNGKTCEFTHPPTCKKFELFGYKEYGCKLKKCDKLHLSLCKKFMKYENCEYGDKCRYFNPKKLRIISQKKETRLKSPS